MYSWDRIIYAIFRAPTLTVLKDAAHRCTHLLAGYRENVILDLLKLGKDIKIFLQHSIF